MTVRHQSLLLAALAVAPLPLAFPAAAQQSGEGLTALEEIVVTARRREESIQSVPVAITALSGDELQARNVTAAEDLKQFVPSLNVGGQRRDEAQFYLRGQGPGPVLAGFRQFNAVATYFAEVPTTIAGPGVFYDLQSVQVLKGPQGTLFGRNTTGGAVLFEPKRPVDRFEGYVQGTLGDYNRRELQGAINIPVVADKLLVRLAGEVARRDGYTESVITGQDQDNRDYKAWRASVTWRPFDGLENALVVNGRHKRDNGTSAVLRQVRGGAPFSFTSPEFAPGVANPFYLGGYLATQQALGPRKSQIGITTFNRQDAVAVVNRTTWEVTDSLTIKNIIGYARIKESSANDYDGTPLTTIQLVPAPGQYTSAQESYSDEFQLQGIGLGGKLNWILGYFYEYAHPGVDLIQRSQQFGTAFGSRVPHYADKSNSVFGHVEYDLADLLPGLQVSSGVRYTHDDRLSRLSILNATATGCLDPATQPCNTTYQEQFQATTWDVTAQYQVTEGTLGYLAVRRGYKSGGFNLPSSAPETRSYQPEYVLDVELGVKSDWTLGGMPGRLNLALFKDRYTDMQLSAPAVTSTGIASVVTNATNADIYGVEAEGTIQPLDGLDLSAFLSFTQAEFGNFRFLSALAPGGGLNLKGRQLPNVPKWKWGVSGRYALPLAGDLGVLSFAADYSHTGKVVGSDHTVQFIPGGVDGLPGYGVANLRVEWQDIAGAPIDLAAFVTNVTNKDYMVGGFPLVSGIGFESVLYGEPRMFGFTLKYRFGE